MGSEHVAKIREASAKAHETARHPGPVTGEEPVIVDMLKFAVAYARDNVKQPDLNVVRDFLGVDVTVAVRRYLLNPRGDLHKLIVTVVLNRASKVRERRENQERFLKTNQVSIVSSVPAIPVRETLSPELQRLHDFLLDLGRPLNFHHDALTIAMEIGIPVEKLQDALDGIVAALDLNGSSL